MKTIPTIPGSDIDAEVARLAALPPLEQRKAFFATLRALPTHSFVRIQLGQVVPRALPKTCGGPWYSHEWEILSGFEWPHREPTAEEQARTADHAEAMAIVNDLKKKYILAQARITYHRSEVDRWSAASNTPNPAKFEEERIEHNRLVERERAVFEEYEEALRNEVLLRGHQPERRLAAGRNWLRFIRRGAQ